MTDLLAEALTLFDNPWSSESWEADRQMGQALTIIADAARRWAWLTVTCETCGGSVLIKTRVPGRSLFEDALWRNCPNCTDGRRVNPEAVEVLARTQWEVDTDGEDWETHSFKGPWLRMAEAGLRAVIEAAGDDE